MAKIPVKLTYRESEPFDVDEDEVEGLFTQGLIQPGEVPRLRAAGLLPPDPAAVPVPPPAPVPAAKPAPGKTEGA